MAFARIGVFEVSGRNLPAVVKLFRDRVTPAFATHSGFLGYQAFTDVCSGRYIGVSYWSSLAALDASNFAAREARDEAVSLGAATVGETFITRQEFDSRAACALA